MGRLLALWLLLAAPAAAQRVGEAGVTIQDFGGLNTYNDSSRIADGAAQISTNVLTERGFIEKRPGSVRQADLTAYGTVKQMGKFINSSNVAFAIVHASNSVYSTDFGAAAVLVTTVAVDADVDGVAAYSRYYIADRITRLVQYSGTSTTTIFAAPICQLLELHADRLWCGDIPAESNSLVRISSFGAATYWTIPASPDTVPQGPDSFYFQRDDGESIECLARTPWGMFVGKPSSTHIVKGKDNATWRKMVIDPDVGCVDDRSVAMRDGRLTWLARDGVYEWPGAGRPEWISRDIDNLVKAIPQTTSISGSVVTDSQANFESGNLTVNGAGAPVSATIIPGSILPSSTTLHYGTTTEFALGTFDRIAVSSSGSPRIELSSYTFADGFGDGNYTSNPTWTLVGGAPPGENGVNYFCSATGAPGSETTVNYLSAPVASSSGSWTFGMQHRISASAASTTMYARYHFLANSTDPAASNGYLYEIQLDNDGVSTHRIMRTASGTRTMLASGTASGYSIGQVLSSTITVARSPQARFIVSGAPVALSEVIDATYSTSTYNIFQAAAVGGASGNTNRVCFSYISHYAYVSSGIHTSAIFDTGLSTPIGGPIVTSVTVRSGTDIRYAVRNSTSPNNDLWTAWSAISTAQASGLNLRYQQFGSTFTTDNASTTPSIFEFTNVATTSATFRSAVSFINSAIASWNSFIADGTVANGGVASFYTRARDAIFGLNDATPAWVAQTNLQTVSASTGAYIQWRVDYAMTTGSATAITARVEWNYDGDSVGPVAAASFDHRYILCAAISSSVVDTCLIHQKNREWTVMDGVNYASLLDFGNDLIAGGDGLASNGYIWRILQNGVYNDDGSAIAATWIGKDFMFAPNGRDWAVGEKVINEIWVDAAVSSRTILNIDYAVNKSTTFTIGRVDLGAYGGMVNRRVDFTNTPSLGKYFKVRFRNSQLDQNFRINAFSIFGEPKGRVE